MGNLRINPVAMDSLIQNELNVASLEFSDLFRRETVPIRFQLFRRTFYFKRHIGHVSGISLSVLFSDKIQFPEMMRAAQRMTAVFISKVRFPMVMHRCPSEFSEDSGGVRRLLPPLFMHRIMRETAR